MKKTSGAASTTGIRAGRARLRSRVLACVTEDRATGVARPQRSTASDKNRIRDGPGDFRLFADCAPADGRTRWFLQHYGGAIAGLQNVAAALAGKHSLG